MTKYEIGVKNVYTGNIYYTGMTVHADNRDKAIDNYFTISRDDVARNLIYANEV
jgi:hypothetical protein